MDDLLSLDFTAQKPRNPASNSSNTFDILARSSSTTPSVGSISRSHTPATAPQAPADDVFSSLFDSAHKNAASSGNMTLGELKTQPPRAVASTAFDVSFLEKSGVTGRAAQQTKPIGLSNDLLTDLLPAGATPQTGYDSDDDIFGLGMKPMAGAAPSKSGVASSVDESFSTVKSPTGNAMGNTISLLDEDTNAFDTLSAATARTATGRSATSKPDKATTTSASYGTTANITADSVPQSALKQLTSMGFTIDESQSALRDVKRDTGAYNIEQAVQRIIEGAGQIALEDGPALPQRPTGNGGARVSSGRRESRDEPRSRASRDSDTLRHAAPQAYEDEFSAHNDILSGAAGKGPANIDTAEILQQAQKVGRSMLNSGLKNASKWWEQGRTTIQKALEEQQQGAGAPRGAPDRPKWMTDALEDDEDFKQIQAMRTSAVREPSAEDAPTTYKSPYRHKKAEASVPPSEARIPPTADLLFSDDGPSTAHIPVTEAKSNTARTQPPRPTVAAAPKMSAPKKTRAIPPIPAQILTAAATAEKAADNLQKAGQFSEAADKYTKALDLLPEDAIQRATVLYSRATSLMHLGSDKRVIADCDTAVLLLTEGKSEPYDLAAIDDYAADVKAQLGLTIPLRKLLGQALILRAKAYEALEKWSEALNDYTSALTNALAGDALKSVNEGIARCRKATAPVAPPAVKAPVRKPPVSTSNTAGAPAAGSAVAALRKANEQAEKEGDLRLALKDGVEAKLSAWKQGKETNLRALISSLDRVLWPELQWKNVGLHELVTDSQVKIKYMRAIAKVHPDKINQNSTVEQQMMAAGVFATLNEAWANSK